MNDQWKKVGVLKKSGVLVPLFSVYSKDSFGTGDFFDLKSVIDWCAKTGNSIVQLLPMNEIGSVFCPYDSLSSFALEPMYISLSSILPGKTKDALLPKMYVDYGAKKDKLVLLRKSYLECVHGDSRELNDYKEENSYWLPGFALFKVLKEHFKGLPWYEWEEKFRSRDKTVLENFKAEQKVEIEFQCWVQWQLYRQFKEVKDYAGKKNVLIKGDLPILVSRDSADVWQQPEFFKLDFAAGAPPDMYCAKGQRWGMPTYKWEKIEADNYRYLKEKLKYAQNFYDILRIDHVVGLFRIWSIPFNDPSDNVGLNGVFDPSEQSKWGEHGRKILSVMQNNTNMLLCAEDLGVIPQVCTDTLKELEIPGNDVQRWVKEWKIKHDFLEPEYYRPLSVAMLSTHDTTNWPAWWENEAGTIDEALFMRKCNERGISYIKVKHQLFDPVRSCHGRLRWSDSIESVEKLIFILGKRKEELADFIDLYENSYREKEKLWMHLGLGGSMREKCDAEIVKAALKITLDSAAVFCVNTIFDWLYLTDSFKADAYEYRVNTPGTISGKNWSLTLPLSLEELLNHKVNREIRSMIESSGRI
jgi:4-alpha-glucanotransferase